MRVLITGSRTWSHRQFIWEQFREMLRRYDVDPHDITIISGACPKGADIICESVAEAYGMTIERHPADWGRYGKRAGFIRNDEMVQTQADLCLAFIRDNSAGATMCADLAEKAGILTVRFYQWSTGIEPLPIERVGL